MAYENTPLQVQMRAPKWLTTGKNEKVHFLHNPAIKFVGYKQLVKVCYALKIMIFVNT